jgi:hypothetical protein
MTLTCMRRTSFVGGRRLVPDRCPDRMLSLTPILGHLANVVSNVGRGCDNGGNTQGRVFLRSRSCGGFGRAGSNGILPLPILQILVWWSGQCLHPVEARRRAGHCGCGTCCHVPKDRSQSAAILQEMRWPSYDQSSSARLGGRICSDIADVEVQRRRPRKLCRNSFAYAGRTPQAEGFS